MTFWRDTLLSTFIVLYINTSIWYVLTIVSDLFCLKFRITICIIIEDPCNEAVVLNMRILQTYWQLCFMFLFRDVRAYMLVKEATWTSTADYLNSPIRSDNTYMHVPATLVYTFRPHLWVYTFQQHLHTSACVYWRITRYDNLIMYSLIVYVHFKYTMW